MPLPLPCCPEEPKRITGFYVNDAATIGDWNTPDMGTWIGAENATYVIGSSRRGGMGAAEAVPFQDGKAAEQFASQFGGRIVSLAEIPRDYILGDAGIDNSDSQAPGPDQTSMNHMHKPWTYSIRRRRFLTISAAAAGSAAARRGRQPGRARPDPPSLERRGPWARPRHCCSITPMPPGRKA